MALEDGDGNDITLGKDPRYVDDPGILRGIEIDEAYVDELATKVKGDPRFHALLKEIGDLHDKKQADYGSDEDPFANVRGSADWGVKPWIGAMIRANDKVKRLQKFARTGTLENEGAKDSFRDLAVYALIAEVLWEEEIDVSDIPF